MITLQLLFFKPKKPNWLFSYILTTTFMTVIDYKMILLISRIFFTQKDFFLSLFVLHSVRWCANERYILVERLHRNDGRWTYRRSRKCIQIWSKNLLLFLWPRAIALRSLKPIGCFSGPNEQILLLVPCLAMFVDQ